VIGRLLSVTIVASFLLAFKAILIEGSEVAILSLATVRQIGKRNVLLGVVLGSLGSVVTFLVVSEAFHYVIGIGSVGGIRNFGEVAIDFGTAAIILYFSYRFLRGFVKYYFGGKSFRDKMNKWSNQVVEEDLKKSGLQKNISSSGQSTETAIVPFSFSNSLPVMSITLTEGFEASLVVAAASAFNVVVAVIGALVSIAVLIGVSAVSYDYLMRVPRWFLDLLAGVVLLSFGTFFAVSGILLLFGVIV
jgi:uncharacterized membrane protein